MFGRGGGKRESGAKLRNLLSLHLKSEQGKLFEGGIPEGGPGFALGG